MTPIKPPKPLLLDLFCGAGGASQGYADAGFDVVGIDRDPQPRYPFRFHQADALAFLASDAFLGGGFAAIHASPPCQGYSVTAFLPQCRDKVYPLLIDPVRAALAATGLPYVIENVVGAPLLSPVRLCGTMFGLSVFRHRLFESSVPLTAPTHQIHRDQIGLDGFCCVAGHGDSGRVRVRPKYRRLSTWSHAMGIHWMLKRELTQAIPPAYTRHIGTQLRAAVQNKTVQKEVTV